MSYRLEQITVRHLSAGGALALHALDLAIAPGEQLAIIGPSGAGKTTLLSTLACAHRPASGRLAVLGQQPWELSERARHALRSRLFLAPQAPPLPPRQRVVNAVLAARLPHWTLWQAMCSLVRPREPDAAHDALQRFGLGDKLYARVDRLSGGERQRCGLARVVLSSAEVFLVDEPLSALDPALARITLAALQQEAARRGATLVCSLHQVEAARASFPRLVGLRDGRIVFDAPREQVTDAMVAALYHNDTASEPLPLQHETPERLAVGACF
ncbi:ATP-binding cassette domain-containing protein [Massilia sp. PAMC28688]|uniref:phosphonate ABC transporter ATP-binding protein n=1 Tax=Massilia sp. PAMC28688 TaxID=2861283 RepID=UPI001C62EB1F|nr:ATP-binding cassette domain-containing protein [Massilia sp. PAMC28688]QYF93635.1 ATP-binding cassette domain-containing protein [Massilia sp. PAMC28688]